MPSVRSLAIRVVGCVLFPAFRAKLQGYLCTVLRRSVRASVDVRTSLFSAQTTSNPFSTRQGLERLPETAQKRRMEEPHVGVWHRGRPLRRNHAATCGHVTSRPRSRTGSVDDALPYFAHIRGDDIGVVPSWSRRGSARKWFRFGSVAGSAGGIAA